MAWKEPSDAQIAAEAPGGNWIVRRLRDAQRRGMELIEGDGVLVVQGTAEHESWPWTTYKTFPLIVPPSFIGDDGCKLAFQIQVHVLGDVSSLPTPGGMVSASVRLAIGSNYSNTIRAGITRSGTGPGHAPTVTGTAELTKGFVAGEVALVEFQMSISNATADIAQGEFTWLAGQRHYFCAMPR